MEEIVKIPAERIRILKDEKNKKMIEKKCNIKIAFEEEEGVRLEGEPQDIYFAKNVILAIGRGFEPKDALLVIDKDYELYIYHLKEEFKSENSIKRVKGRVIGKKGKTKKEIEDATESRISVYGNTIAILAKPDAMEYARTAVEKLLHGAMHSSVYRYLSEARRKIFEERLRGI
jgi:ribosomal RNA assembly protein